MSETATASPSASAEHADAIPPARAGSYVARHPIIDWPAGPRDDFGAAPQMFKHNLHNSPAFDDERLINLIEHSARDNYYVNTMDVNEHNIRSRREGEFRDISGRDALKAIETGKIWTLLLHPDKVDPGYGHLVDEIYEEFAREVPGFKAQTRKMSILISSPGIQVYYHCDVPGQTLWQVRGQKKVFVYPNHPPFLDQAALERIVLNEAHEISLPYDPAFDNDAVVYDLKPGEMLHWPLNAPHRIVNGNMVNVSFTTEHFSKPIRRSFIVNYANGLLRRELGWNKLAQKTTGPGYWAKLGVAGLYKLTGRQKQRNQTIKVDFVVDPSAPGGFRTIPGYEFRK